MEIIRFIKSYLILSGIAVNMGVFAAGFYGVYKLIDMGVDAETLAERVADRIEPDAPSVSGVLRRAFMETSASNVFEGESLANWQGKGAKRGLQASLLDDVDHADKLPPESRLKLIMVESTTQFMEALAHAMPGDVIVLKPGEYEIEGHNIPISRPGLSGSRIYVQADRLGDVILKMNTLEGFYVDAPFWVFQNLEIEGVCKNDGDCEHAFHVVGDGNNVVIRNNVVRNFNAHIKVNSTQKNGVQSYPDNGLIANNNFYNEAVRRTDSPVTLLDIVAVNDWVVRDNLIADFIKGGGDHVSYAAFFKGNGARNVFEQNLVFCRFNLFQERGAQVGLSFGGGGTDDSACRDGKCDVEHRNGTIRHNVIMHCDDVGVYLNKAENSEVYNNTIINTRGIDVRFPESTAVIASNVVTGRIKERDGGSSRNYSNVVMHLANAGDYFTDPMRANFNLVSADRVVDAGVDLKGDEKDFCGKNLSRSKIDIGAFEYIDGRMACDPLRIQ